MSIANFWEKVGSLTRAGHVTPVLLANLGLDCRFWWSLLAPWVKKNRADDSEPNEYEQCEWAVARMGHPTPDFDRESFDKMLELRITNAQATLGDLEAMRTVIVASPPSVT